MIAETVPAPTHNAPSTPYLRGLLVKRSRNQK